MQGCLYQEKKEKEKKLPYRCSGMDSALIFFDRSERFFNHRSHDQVKGGRGNFKKKYQEGDAIDNNT